MDVPCCKDSAETMLPDSTRFPLSCVCNTACKSQAAVLRGCSTDVNTHSWCIFDCDTVSLHMCFIGLSTAVPTHCCDKCCVVVTCVAFACLSIMNLQSCNLGMHLSSQSSEDHHARAITVPQNTLAHSCPPLQPLPGHLGPFPHPAGLG